MVLMYSITTSICSPEIKTFKTVVYQNWRFKIIFINRLPKAIGIWFQILQENVCYLISALRIMHQSPGEGTEIATQRGMVEGLHSERYD